MAITSFIIYLKSEKRYSKHTVKAYQIDLEQFAQFTAEQYNLDSISEATTPMIRDWTASLKAGRFDHTSINRKLSSLRSYFMFLQKNKQIETNPVDKIRSLKVKKRVSVFVPFADMENYSEIENETSFASMRNKLIIEILYQSGIRLSELIKLKDADIDLQTLTFKVTGKRNKQRILPFHPQMKSLILEYKSEKNKLFPITEFLIVSNKGKKSYSKMIYTIVNSELKKITTLSKTSPHVLRHTFATHLLNNGAALLAVKELLGHTSLASTQVYTHNSIAQLKKIHQQAHPKG